MRKTMRIHRTKPGRSLCGLCLKELNQPVTRWHSLAGYLLQDGPLVAAVSCGTLSFNCPPILCPRPPYVPLSIEVSDKPEKKVETPGWLASTRVLVGGG